MISKRIRDPLYDFILVDDQDLNLIDHKLVQRLRWVSQLPLEQLVYPSAQHSRFEHSLGVMHLAGIAAEKLATNSKDRFQEAAYSHDELKDKGFQEQKEIFIRCARWAGLLHDIGHAPFSHTLEDACKFSHQDDISYDHEFFGAFLVRRVFEDLKINDFVSNIVQRVLNKEIQLQEILIRHIIDGPMDVDKGDYLPRDSYHCGVNYGVYDHHFLWANVVITDSFQMGILPKAALEVWSLVLARYKMLSYVYKHHIRNITDALLVEILQMAFDNFGQSRESRDILPLRSQHDVNRDEYVHKFVHWTDNSLIKEIDALEDSKLSSKIEAFSSRKLYKRGFCINLSEYANAVGNEAEVLSKVNVLRDEMSRKAMDWNAMPVSEILIPVFDSKVQRDILVQDSCGAEKPLAEYLGFGVEEKYVREKGDTFLHIFIHPQFLSDIDELNTKIKDILKYYEA